MTLKAALCRPGANNTTQRIQMFDNRENQGTTCNLFSPYDSGRNWQRQMARGYANVPMQHGVFRYHERPRHPITHQPPNANNTFQFPTRIGGRFARAMSSITRNPEEGASGTGVGINHSDNNFRQKVSHALAIN